MTSDNFLILERDMIFHGNYFSLFTTSSSAAYSRTNSLRNKYIVSNFLKARSKGQVLNLYIKTA